MQKESPCKSDRFAKFATIRQAGCEMTKGRRRNWLARAVPPLVLIAAIGHFTTARAEAASQPSHQDIQNSVGAAQTTVNSIGTNVNAVQTTVTSIGTKVDGVQTTVNGLDTKVDDVQSALDSIPPTWSQILSAADRFRLVMGGTAVLDKETGLVWEQSPSTTAYAWLGAHGRCNAKTVGGRKGWRLPTIQELASLIDPTQVNPALPAGHPFSNVQSSVYWSATTDPSDASFAFVVYLDRGAVLDDGKTVTHYVWCVRGGQGVDPQ